MENLITTVKTVSELIENFESGSLAIPEIQRTEKGTGWFSKK